MEGGKTENFNNSTNMSSKFSENQHEAIPRWLRVRTYNLEFSGERQRANRIRHPSK